MIGLIFGCPVGEEMEDCPLRTLRKLPFNERIREYERLSAKEKDKIQLHHDKCLARREGKLLDP
jgi:hypothetical protein